MGVLFGTDGVRGLANIELTPEMAFRLGMAAAYFFGKGEHPRFVIGKDTRISGDLLEAALTAGICSVGGDCLKAGVLPTPGLACLTKTLGCSAGIVISASHNPFQDNGIKFFGKDGFKLSDTIETKIEELVLNESYQFPRPSGSAIGKVWEKVDGERIYLNFLQEVAGLDLKGLKLVLDCANGAASYLAPKLFSELGADVVVIHGEPDGLNINEGCGSTHPHDLQKAVKENEADLGLAFDGDADRLLVVDEKGNLVDGDQIIVICALARKRAGLLLGNRVVVTVMSNLGLKEALQKENIEISETRVGDRYILEEMQKTGAVLGGEQSGHIVFLDRTTTGDGLLTALELLKVLKMEGRTLSLLAEWMRHYPQILVNVRVRDKEGFLKDSILEEKIRQIEESLDGNARVLVRPSGTEPLVRVMAEGLHEKQLEDVVNEIAATISGKWG